MKNTLRFILRWLPLALLVLGLFCFFYFQLYEFISFKTLQTHHQTLQAWTDEYYIYTVLVYMLVYIAAVAVSIPGATLLTLTGGYLFGIFAGVLYVVFSATLGASLLFLAVKTTIGDWLAKKAGRWIKYLEKGFQHNAFNYLLFLRLIPLFPFWVINIVPALLKVRLAIFVAATLIGILPGSLVYVMAGNGLGSLLATEQTPDLTIIFNPSIFLPLIGLAVLSLVPVIYKKLK